MDELYIVCEETRAVYKIGVNDPRESRLSHISSHKAGISNLPVDHREYKKDGRPSWSTSIGSSSYGPT